MFIYVRCFCYDKISNVAHAAIVFLTILYQLSNNKMAFLSMLKDMKKLVWAHNVKHRKYREKDLSLVFCLIHQCSLESYNLFNLKFYKCISISSQGISIGTGNWYNGRYWNFLQGMTEELECSRSDRTQSWIESGQTFNTWLKSSLEMTPAS